MRRGVAGGAAQPNAAAAAAKRQEERPPPAGGNALVTFDAQLAKQQEKKEIEKHRAPRDESVATYTGPKVKWEETGLYKAMVKSAEIEDELTKLRNLIRKRTDPNYEPGDDDFNVAPCRKFDVKVDYYKLLEVDDLASMKDIKGAYKKLALQYHPDKNRDKKPAELSKMQEEFNTIQEAYEILTDRATRRQYDRQKFDEARAKSQGMNSSMYSQGANTDSNFWGRWSGEKKKGKKPGGGAANLDVEGLKKAMEGVGATKAPKGAETRVEVRISLDKALRGGLKIREVKRDRMQRSYGSATKTGKTFHVPISPGQADGSEHRLEGEGNWHSFGTMPGDMVFEFRHKPHAYLRQAKTEGDLEVALPLTVRAKATQQVLSAWSPTFKGQMLLLRFRNPLLPLAPCRTCSLCFHIDREGFPIGGDPSKRGALVVHVNVQLDGDGLTPSFGTSLCRETLLRRHARDFNRQPQVKVELSGRASHSAPVRKYLAHSGKERGGRRVALPAVAAVWESPPETDLVAFAKAASALGFHAKANALGFGWCCHPLLAHSCIGDGDAHVSLRDDEIESDEEQEAEAAGKQDEVVEEPPPRGGFDFDDLPDESEAEPPAAAQSRGGFDFDALPEGSEAEPPAAAQSRGGFDFDALPEGSEAPAPAQSRGGGFDFDALPEEPSVKRQRRRVLRRRPEAEEFMLAFSMGPPEGLPDPPSTDEEEGATSPEPAWAPAVAAAQPRPPARRAERPEARAAGISVKLAEGEQEGEEEQELTRVIRQKQTEMEQLKRKMLNRKHRLKGEREEEESTLRQLLEKDKQREYDRIEKEMNGLRSKFEFEVTTEKKWMDQFIQEVGYQNQWVCVFKPSMVARRKPTEDGPVTRRIMFDEVVKAKEGPTDDHWLRLEGSDEWAAVWHAKHGQLLTKWFGKNQSRFHEIEAKIGARRKNRNQTFIDYKRKKKEVSEWELPPGPTEEEQWEIEDDEGEQLSNVLEPILQDLKERKRRLRELRQRRLEAAAERAKREAGEGPGLASGQLPEGFQLEEQPSTTSETALTARDPNTPAPAPPIGEVKEWETKKQAADKAFKERDWNTALSFYSQALEVGGGDLEAMQCATLLSNRALVHGRLGDWEKSLADATDATVHQTEWPKGWLRRATAELRVNEPVRALASLKHGFKFAEKLTGQFLPLATELESALYADRDVKERADPDAPNMAVDRISVFKQEGTKAFDQANLGLAVFFYTRALFHRSMMEGRDEAIILSNRSACFLKLGLPNEALADALAAADKESHWEKPLVRAGQAALLMNDFKTSYQYFAKARRIESNKGMSGASGACDGVNSCLQRMIRWEYPAASKRWSRFGADRARARQSLRVWALSDVFFDQHGVPEWCKSLSSSFFRDDVLMVAGNLADALPNLKFALTVLKSKFRRIFYVPGNHDLWVRRVTLGTIIKGEKVKEEERTMVDSVSKFLEVLQVCDELGVETAPAEVAAGVFVVPMFSWYSRDFIPPSVRKEHASKSDADAKVTIDQWVKWPFPGGADDAWKFFMRMNEPALRATLVAKAAFERFASTQATILTMTHFLTRQELKIDWTVPGEWDYVGCDGLDEQIRTIGSDVHVYGRACTGDATTLLEGVSYVHNYIGTTDKHRPGMAPYCIYDRGQAMPQSQPSQEKGFNFQPLTRPEEPDSLLKPRTMGGG